MNVRTLTPYVSSSHTPAPANSANKAHSSKLGVELSMIDPTAGAPGVLLLALKRLRDRVRKIKKGEIGEGGRRKYSSKIA